MKKPSTRNGKIDFLRFIFAICVVLNHAKHVMPTDALSRLFNGYSFAVEFFFLISGYLLMASIEKAEKYSTAPLSRETGSFLLKKYRSVYPEVAVAYFAGVILICSLTDATPLGVIKETWFDLTMLVSSGMNGPQTILLVWYISSMIIAMAVLYPLLRKFKTWTLHVILPIAIPLLLGYLYQNYNTIRGPMEWMGITFRGNLRALAELGLGVVCYEITKKMRSMDFNFFGRVLLAVAELAGYGAVLYYMASESGGVSDFFYLLVLCVSVIITCSQKSVGSRWFNNNFSAFLGKYSLCVFLAHGVFFRRMVHFFPFSEQLGWKRRLVLYMAVSMVNGLAVLLISNFIRKIGPKVGAGIKKLVLKQNG